MTEAFRSRLFADDGENAYVLIDGASCAELLSKLDAWEPDHVCLLPGELTPDLEEVAPYLVELSSDHPFTDWFLGGFQGQHWGIFARSAAGLRSLRKHFRAFVRVKSPDDKLLYFRYYDPRVLATFLPTTNAEEREAFFGRVSAFFCESADGGMTVFQRRGGELDQQACVDPTDAATTTKA